MLAAHIQGRAFIHRMSEAAEKYAKGDAAGREIRAAKVVCAGMCLPRIAFAVKKESHAPNAIGLFERGFVRHAVAGIALCSSFNHACH